MRHLLTLVIFLCSRHALPAEEENSFSEEAWLHEGVTAQAAKFKHFTLVPHPAQKGIVAANCEHEPSWWSALHVFHQTGDPIDWMASFPADYEPNCYILSVRWVHLAALNLWILEVLDSTHMGNGSLWLFALEDHQLRTLLHTRAVDRHREYSQRGQPLTEPASEIFRNGRLTVKYPRAKSAPYESVSLTGTVVLFNAEDRELSTHPYAESWTWDSAQRIFTKARP